MPSFFQPLIPKKDVLKTKSAVLLLAMVVRTTTNTINSKTCSIAATISRGASSFLAYMLQSTGIAIEPYARRVVCHA